MADLDDFFAKKDRKKKTKKPRDEPSLPVEVVKKPAAAAAVVVPVVVVPTPVEVSEGGESTVPVEEEETKLKDPDADSDEWKDFDDDRGADLTGLKITQLAIQEESDKNDEDDDDGGERGADGKVIPVPGPWKIQGAEIEGGSSSDSDDETPPEPPSRAVPPSVTPEPSEEGKGEGAAASSYVPPHLRGRGAGGSTPSAGSGSMLPSRLGRRGGTGKHAPDISNEELFPTLGASMDPKAPIWNTDTTGFESVRHGGRVQQPSSSGGNRGPNLSQGNRFSALSQ